MAYLTNGVITVSLDIEWDLSRQTELIRSMDRGVGGRQASSNWGSYSVFTVPVLNIPSSDAAQINEWWRDTVELTFYLDTNSYTSYLTGATQPFQGLSKPYSDEWNGNLIVEMI